MPSFLRFACAALACLLLAGTRAPDARAQALSGFVFTQEIVNPEPAINDRFGGPISLSGNRVAIGAYLNDTNGLSNAGAAYVYRREAGLWVPDAQPLPNDPDIDDWFGVVSLDGERLAVGAQEKNNRIGAAYIFDRDPASGLWNQQAKLLPVTPATSCSGTEGCRFGGTVSLQGDTVAVGSYEENAQTGAAYVFTRNAQGAWVQQARLLGSDIVAGSRLGSYVALDGDTLLAGAFFHDVTSERQGAAYVFVRSQGTWTEQARLLAPDGDGFDLFGSAVALDGNTAVVGARAADLGSQMRRGAAYVFVRNGTQWTLQARLNASDGVGGGSGNSYGDQFGYSVKVRGDDIWVGKYPGSGVTPMPGRNGAVYHYRRNAGVWTEIEHFTPPSGSPGDGFANAIALDGRVLLIGANLEGSPPDEVSMRGTVYAYTSVADDRIFADDFE